ncbi:MAG: winged helix-turn-helix transcriptional regulator [Candidatus Thermoplasmatota archaeon]
MIKLDAKDRKILYELDLDARQSLNQIGKKVGLKKDVVSYRIQRMQDEGIIKNFWTAINTFKLGYNVYRIYINFQYVTTDKKNEIIQHFVNYKNSWAVLSVKGEIDLDVVVWVNDIYEFYQFWEKTVELYGEYFANSAISILVYVNSYKKSFLLLDEQDTSNRLMYQVACGGKPVEIDEIDYNILNELAVNARIPIIELSEKIGCSSQTINYRIQNLTKNGIIQAFRINIDISKLNLEKFAVDIYLKDLKHKHAIIEYLKNLPSLEYIDIALGWADLQLELIVQNANILTQIMDQIATQFPNAIKKQNLMIDTCHHKERWLPDFF